MRSTFLHREKPLLTVMLEMNELDTIYRQIAKGNADGADAYGVELNRTPLEMLNLQTLRGIFERTEDKPIYVTCYPKGTTEHLTNDEREEKLLLAHEAGATLVDVNGGWYDDEVTEFSRKLDVAEKQARLCERFHSHGAEVLMSSHFYEFLTKEQVLDIARQQRERGADVVKIISWTSSRQELCQNVETGFALKEEGHTYLFASNGPWCKLHRYLAPFFGSNIILCTQRYAEGTSQVQPLLADSKKAMELMPWQEPVVDSESMDMNAYKY